MLPEHSMYTVARLLSGCVWVALFGALFQTDSIVFATETKLAVPRPQDHVSYYGHKQVQEGDDFIIHCFVSKGTNALWTKDGWPLRSVSQSGAYTVSEYTQGLQVSRLQVWNAEPYHSGVYSCSERSSASHVLEVSPRSASRPDASLCHNLVPNESLHLDCGLAGTKNVAWYKDGKPLILSDDISFGTGTTLEIKHATERDVGVYGCADSHGEQQAPIANVLRLITPIFIEPFPGTVRVHPGEPVQLVCHAHSLPEPRVSWSTGEKHQSSGAVLSIRRAATSDAGAYTCKATHESCEQFVAERPVTLKVFESTMRTNEPYQGNGITLVPGSESLSLRCDYPYNRDLKIYWFMGNERAPIQPSNKYNIDRNGQFLTIRQPSEKDVSNYTCVAFDSLVNESAVIIVGLRVKIRTEHTKTFVEHSDGYLHCAVEGVPKPVVRWYRNNKEMHIRGSKKFVYKSISGAFGDTIVLRRLETKDSAMFTCVADNGHSQDRKVMHVFVKGKHKAVFPFLFICLEVALLITIAVKWRNTKLEKLQQPPAQIPRAEESGQTRPEAPLEEKLKKKEDLTIAELNEFLHLVESTEVPCADIEKDKGRLKKPEASYPDHEPARIPAKGASLFSEPSGSQQKLEKQAKYLDECMRPESIVAAGTNETTLKLDVIGIPTESQVIRLEGPRTSTVPEKSDAFNACDVTFMAQPGVTIPETPSPETSKMGLLGSRPPGKRLASIELPGKVHEETGLSKTQVRELSGTGLTETEMLGLKHSKPSLAVKRLDEPALQRSGVYAPKQQAEGYRKRSKLPPESLLSPELKSALTDIKEGKEGTDEALEVPLQREKLLSPQLNVKINKPGSQHEEIARASKDKTSVRRPSVSLAMHKKKEEKIPTLFEAYEKSSEHGKGKKESQSLGSEPFSPNLGPGEFYEIDTKVTPLPHGGRKESFPEPTVLSSTPNQSANEEWVTTMSRFQGQSFEFPSQTTSVEEEKKRKNLDESTPVASGAIRERLWKPSEIKPPTKVSSKELLGVSSGDIDLNDKNGGKVTRGFKTQGTVLGMSASEETEFGPPNEPLRDVALSNYQKNGMPHKQPSEVTKDETSEIELKPSLTHKGRASAAGKAVVDPGRSGSAFGETSPIPPGSRPIELRLPPLPQALDKGVVYAKHSPKPLIKEKDLTGTTITTDSEHGKKHPDYKKPLVTLFETRAMEVQRKTAASLSPDKAVQRASTVVEEGIKPISSPRKDSLEAEKPQKKLKTVNGASEITAADSARLNLYGKEPSVPRFQIRSTVRSVTPELSDKLSKPPFVRIGDSKKPTAVPDAAEKDYSTTEEPRTLSTVSTGATGKAVADHDVPSTATKITVVTLPESKTMGRLNQLPSLVQEDSFIQPTLTEDKDKLKATVLPDKTSVDSPKTKGFAITTKRIPAAHGEDLPAVTESMLDVIVIPSSGKEISFSAAPLQDKVEKHFHIGVDDSGKQMSVRDDACLALVPDSTAPSDRSGPTTEIFSPVVDFKEDRPIKPAVLSDRSHLNNKLKKEGKYEVQSSVPQIQKKPEPWSAGVVKYHSNETELSSSSLPSDFNRKQIPPKSSFSTPNLPSDTSSEYIKMLPKNIAKERNQEVKKLASSDVDVNLATRVPEVVQVKTISKPQGETPPKEAPKDQKLKSRPSKTAGPGSDSTIAKEYGAEKSPAFSLSSSPGEQPFPEAGSLTIEVGTSGPGSSTIPSCSVFKEQEGPEQKYDTETIAMSISVFKTDETSGKKSVEHVSGGTLQFPATPKPADGKSTVFSETGRQHAGKGSHFLTLHPFEFIVPSDTELEEETSPKRDMKVHFGGSQERYRWFDSPHGRRRHTEPSSTSTERDTALTERGVDTALTERGVDTALTERGVDTLSITEPLDAESLESSAAGPPNAAYVKGSVQSPKQC